MAGVLYMVATPIGNLGDVSSRARDILVSVSLVVCEDTRVTRKLLDRFGLKVAVASYHHHSSLAVLVGLVARLGSGESLAYVSDAGTPGLADPGSKLVAAAASAGVKVVPIPGPSAVAAALSVAGFPGNEYLFLGYPPHKKGRQSFFRRLGEYDRVIVFFESTHRIVKTLTELHMAIAQRPLVVARELTKVYEHVYRGTAVEVLAQVKADSTKGEFVIVVGPKK